MAELGQLFEVLVRTVTRQLAASRSRTEVRDRDSQSGVHGLKGLLGLVEEAKDDGGAEVGVSRLVHLENLVEGAHVDGIAEVELCTFVTDGLRLSGRVSVGAAARWRDNEPYPRTAT